MNPQFLVLLESVQPGRIFGLDSQTVITTVITLLNVSLLAFFLSKLLYNPVRNFLHNRTARIQDALKHASDEKLSAGELRVKYEAKLRDIESERDEILEEARKQSSQKSKQLLDEAKADAEDIRQRAVRNVEMEQERVKDEMRKSIIELSSVMAQKFVTRTMDSDTQEKLFAEVIAELDGADFSAAS